MFTPNVSQIPPAIAAARKLLTAGQVRADREIAKVDAMSASAGRGDLSESLAFEAGAFRGVVRNLCAELAAFDPEDGSVEVEYRGIHLWVHITSEQIQANGCDISALLSQDDRCAVVALAEEVQREQRIDDAYRARYAA